MAGHTRTSALARLAISRRSDLVKLTGEDRGLEPPSPREGSSPRSVVSAGLVRVAASTREEEAHTVAPLGLGPWRGYLGVDTFMAPRVH